MAESDDPDTGNKIVDGLKDALEGRIVRMKTYEKPQAAAPEHPFGFYISEMDTEAFFNMRDWLRGACEAAGGRFTGGGIGMGQADIDIEMNGCRYNISIKPLPR